MSGKVAIVTGSNKGLGYAIVKGLCQKFNGTVYLTARDENRGHNAVEELEKIGLKPAFHQLDINNSDSVKELADFIKLKHGGIDVLVNNAAILEWDEIYPSYDAAKRNIDVNYKSLLTIEQYLFPLLRDGARVVNISSACGHLSNIKKKIWLKKLVDPDLTEEEINEFVDDYLDSIKNGTFKKEDFADDGKHAEHRVSKIALTALTKVQQKKYIDRNISINAVNPGHVKTDMAHGGGVVDSDEAAKVVLHLILDASSKVKGAFMWNDGKLVDWFDVDADLACTGVW